MTESKKSTREKAAAARAAAEAEQRKRDNRVRLIGGIAIAVVVALIVGLGIWGSRQNQVATGVDDAAAVPTGVYTSGDYAWGVPYNTAEGKKTLAIWEDFQCPACGSLENNLGETIQKLATDGKYNLVWRPTTFLDPRFVSGPNPNSSQRAAMAWGCAVDAGKTAEYHNVVFQNQPATEGDGWTDDQLLAFGKQVGISGDAYTTFETCFNDAKYKQWTVNSYTVFQDSNVPGTPSLHLDGVEVPTDALADAAAFEKWIDENS